MKNTLIIVDISSFIFRAFYAIRPMTAPDGTPVNALYGVTTMMLKLFEQYKGCSFVLARDIKGPSFRHQLYDLYKANRSEAPDDLKVQFPLIDELVEKLKVCEKRVENYEADDVIGSLVVQFKDQFDKILIASGDKDLMQFVDDKVSMVDTMKDKVFGPGEVYEKLGVHPEQVVDYLSLIGDTSDNIPGVKGIGAKGAQNLLKEYKTGQAIFEHIEDIKNKRAKTALENGIESFKLSRSLVEIKTDLELTLTPKLMSFEFKAYDDLIEFFKRYDFKSLIRKISSTTDLSSLDDVKKSSPIKLKSKVFMNSLDEDLVFKSLELHDQVYFEYLDLKDESIFLLSTTDEYIIIRSELVDKETLSKWLFEGDYKVISSDLKKLFRTHSLTRVKSKEIEKFVDITLAHFCYDPELSHDLSFIGQEILFQDSPSHKDFLKMSLKNDQDEFDSKLMRPLMQRAYVGLHAYPMVLKKLEGRDLFNLYAQLEMPLLFVLLNMENRGVLFDKNVYKELKSQFQEEIDFIESHIFELAGEKINLKSPKQVASLLFERLGLPVIKKTKTGASTDSSVLQKLSDQSEVASKILLFRELEKILSTYVDVLPTMVDPDERLRTTYNQAVTHTGRLSSERPNLQNIPIKTDKGRMLRKGFRASPGKLLLACDYSQVELRLLAHFSKDPVMLKAFQDGEDIHAQTAREIFALQAGEEVTREQRSYAKAINFGLMYGQSSFGLSQMLNIAQSEARDYIQRYFKRFSKVKGYLDHLKDECAKSGHTLSLMGRRRYIKDIHSSNKQVKAQAERMAINTPIQSTAADIIKKAMINIEETLGQRSDASMLLQVHDELIFEIDESSIDEVSQIVKREMENVVELSVPLLVDMGQGLNWYELK